MFKTVLHDAVFDPGVSRVSTEGAVGKTLFGKKNGNMKAVFPRPSPAASE